MRIVHVAIRYPPAEGGGERHVQAVCRHLVKLGHEVHVLTTKLAREVPFEMGSYKDESVDEGIFVHRLPVKHVLPLWGYGNKIIGLIEKLEELNPDIVHLHGFGYRHSDLVARQAKKHGWKTVLISHGFIPGRGAMRFIKPFYELFVAKKTCRLVDSAIALSEEDKGRFQALGARNIQIIANGINVNDFTDLPQSDIFRKKYAIEGRMILNVSRLARVKGQDMLLEAFSQLNAKDAYLVLIGEDWGLKKELEAKAESLAIDDKVIFAGKVSEEVLLSAYAAADLFVLSSRLEPFGIVLLEAMACGIPVVATRVGGIPSVVGDCARLCEPTTSSIKSGMAEMLHDEKIRKTASDCGVSRAKKFDWSETAKKVDSIYRKII